MHSQTTPQENPAASVTPPVQLSMPWRLTFVEPLPDWRLQVRFLDGTEGMVDMAGLVHSPEAGVFAALADPARFGQVYLHLGAATWPDGIDLAPDAMYEAIREKGVWRLN